MIQDCSDVNDILFQHIFESGPDYDTEQKFIIPPSGFIPNSVLIKLLWPQDEVKKLEEDMYKPPTLSEEQLEMLQHMEKVSSEVEIEFFLLSRIYIYFYSFGRLINSLNVWEGFLQSVACFLIKSNQSICTVEWSVKRTVFF